MDASVVLSVFIGVALAGFATAIGAVIIEWLAERGEDAATVRAAESEDAPGAISPLLIGNATDTQSGTRRTLSLRRFQLGARARR